MVVVVLLALGQLGVNTELLTLAFAAVLLCLASAMALLIGLGGRHVAREVAAGRYLRRIVNEGDHVRSGEVEGTVVALHAATTEMDSADAAAPRMCPNTLMLQGPITVTRPPGSGAVTAVAAAPAPGMHRRPQSTRRRRACHHPWGWGPGARSGTNVRATGGAFGKVVGSTRPARPPGRAGIGPSRSYLRGDVS